MEQGPPAFILVTTLAVSDRHSISGHHIFLTKILPKSVGDLFHLNPRFKFEINAEIKYDALEQLLKGEIDIAFYPCDKKDSTDFHRGMYRIYDESTKQDIGVHGMVDIGLRSIYDKDKVVESLTFLKEENLRKGYGRTLIDSFFRYFEKEFGDHIVYTIKYDNPMTHKICTEHVPIHIGMIRDKDNDKGWTNLFTVDYEFAKKKTYIQDKVLPIFTNKLNKTPTSNVEKLESKKLSNSKEPTPKL